MSYETTLGSSVSEVGRFQLGILSFNRAFNSEFIKDCNVPDGTQLRPNVKFEKMWMLKNTGKLEWSHETFPVKLICVSGNIFVLNDNHVDVKNTAQNEIATVSVNLMTPSKPGGLIVFLFLALPKAA